MLSSNEIIEGFGKIMTRYLFFMDQSDMVRNSNYLDTILYNGANIVIHVFTIYVYADYNLEHICSQCCKAYVCYLEYIEQLEKTNLANNLYISDISMFVYKLTLGELFDEGGELRKSRAIGKTSQNVSNNHCIDLVVKTWNILLGWNSPISFQAKIAICDSHLTHFAKLLYSIPLWQSYLDYLEIIQEKLEMDENVYFAFLNEYYRRIYKLKHTKKLPNDVCVMEKILLFCTQYHSKDEVNEDNIRSLVSVWLN